MSNKLNLSEFSDSIIAFLDYGVRSWLLGIPLLVTLMLFEAVGIITLLFTIMAMIAVFLIMAILWFNDFYKGYVPKFWLRLSYTNQFWATKKQLPKRV